MIVDWNKNMEELRMLAEQHADSDAGDISAGGAMLACASLLCHIGHELQNLVEEVSRIRKGEGRS